TPPPTSGNADAKRRADGRTAPGWQELLGGTRGFAPTSRRFRWPATTGDDEAVVAVIQKSEPRVARPRQDPSGVVPDDSRNASPVAAPNEITEDHEGSGHAHGPLEGRGACARERGRRRVSGVR